VTHREVRQGEDGTNQRARAGGAQLCTPVLLSLGNKSHQGSSLERHRITCFSRAQQRSYEQPQCWLLHFCRLSGQGHMYFPCLSLALRRPAPAEQHAL
jgi:hypothetical protein